MDNDKHLQGEIDGFWGDIKATQEILSYERENLAKALKNGLGDNIKEYLTNPTKPSVWKRVKIKIKQLFGK